MSAAAERHTTHVTLNIKSTSGNLQDQRFADEDRAQAVLDRAIDKIPLSRHPDRPYTLVLERTGATLALHEALRALGLRDGDTIIVQAGQPVDG